MDGLKVFIKGGDYILEILILKVWILSFKKILIIIIFGVLRFLVFIIINLFLVLFLILRVLFLR